MERIEALHQLIKLVAAIFFLYATGGIIKELRNPINMDEYEKKHRLPRRP